MTDFLKGIRRFLLGEGPDMIEARARIAKDMIDKEARGLKADIQQLVDNEDDPFDALMRNMYAARNHSRMHH